MNSWMMGRLQWAAVPITALAGSVLLAQSASADPVSFVDCGHHSVRSLSVTDCDHTACTVHHGRPTTVELTFVSSRDSARLKVSADADSIPVVRTDACSHATPACPVRAGTEVTLRWTVTPPPVSLRHIPVTVKVTGDHGHLMACAETHVSVS